MKKRAFFLLLLLLIPLTSILSQEIALKTNVLSWATTTINLGAEFKISPRLTAGADIMYKGWSFLSDNRKMGGFLVQPEAKYWFCIPFYKHFMGLHAHYGQYNGGFSKYRYQGDLYGIGLSYGYQWIWKRRWNIEVSAGIGYASMNYDKYERPKCGLFPWERPFQLFWINQTRSQPDLYTQIANTFHQQFHSSLKILC